MYCFFTTVPVAFYWARSDDTVHYKSDEMVNFLMVTFKVIMAIKY